MNKIIVFVDNNRHTDAVIKVFPFYLPRICYRAYIKYPNRKDKVYIKIVGYEDDIWTEDVEKKHASIWQDFSEFAETLECLFWENIENGDVEYVKIEPCIKCVKPWWKMHEKNWFEYIKSCIISFFNFRMNIKVCIIF